MDRAARHCLLGPRLKIGLQARLAWASVGVVCAAVLVLARFLTPDPRGLGTHEQLLGLAPCSFVLTTGLPCPTCGMTTAFAYTVRGRLVAAFLAQPAGAILCLACICLLVFSLHVAATGKLQTVNWSRVGPVRLMLSIGLLILGGWAFKIAYGLLTGRLPMRH